MKLGWPHSLVIVRHGEAECEEMALDERLAMGWSPYSVRLTPTGRKQAIAVGRYFARERGPAFDGYYHSPYERAVETMELLCAQVDVNPASAEDGRLVEVQRGIWHFMTDAEVKACVPWELRRKAAEPRYFYRPLGGENWLDAELRLTSFLQSMRMDHAGEDVCVVTHGHAIILLRRLLDRTTIEETVAEFEAGDFVPHGSVTTYKETGGIMICAGTVEPEVPA